jgi:hypothetical protein
MPAMHASTNAAIACGMAARSQMAQENALGVLLTLTCR